MVMDGTPGPECVGREFVRQYYTLLNEAPQFLHRFYSNNSSFIHGGEARPGEEEQKPVIGQSDIHKKIMSLNFRDCHAKIRYVDSQSTIATGVVVQVTGELSNNQAPLRRFMQTFVLAPQTPNKYYVHNDIFRYQDEVFADSDDEDELAEEDILANEVSGAPSPSPAEPPAQPAMIDSHSENTVHLYHQQLSTEHDLHPQQQVNGRVMVGVAEPVMANGHKQDAVSPPPPVVQAEEPVQRMSSPEPPVPSTTPQPVVEASAEPVGRVEVHPPSHQLPPEEPESSNDTPKPRSWANIAHVSGGAAMPTQTPAVNVQQPSGFHGQTGDQLGSSVEKPAPNTQRVPPMRNNRPGTTLEHRAFGDVPVSNKPSRTDEGPAGDDKRPERVKYPDSQQVFVGNLPNSIAEFELRDFFREYGTVLEVRINRNSPNKLHFGFVVFENDADAQKVLGRKSLDYNGHRLNIEEKKPRSDNRPHSSSRPGGRRDGPRNRGRGGNFSGPPREHSGGRTEHGRFNNLNKSSQHRR